MGATGSPDAAVREIAGTPELIAEVRAILPELKRTATAPAGEDGVRRVIAKRFELYPQPQRTTEQWDAWWSDYFDVLGDIALASLEAGMRAYVADPSSEFMPKPGKLRELAFSAPCRSLSRYYRAKMALQAAEEKPAPVAARVEPAEVASMLAEVNAGLKTVEARPALPSIAGKVDERGLTQEMRDLIARRERDAR